MLVSWHRPFNIRALNCRETLSAAFDDACKAGEGKTSCCWTDSSAGAIAIPKTARMEHAGDEAAEDRRRGG